MDIMEKLEILGSSAKYDASCSSSGVARGGSKGVGSAVASGICHSWSADGRCISLLKVLQSNRCIYKCAYCINNALSDTKRAEFTPQELCDITLAFYRRNYIEGLFLSSAVTKSPDHTMEMMVQTLRLLRKADFGGYIHLKTIPGASHDLIDEGGRLADRMSVNIELPTRQSLRLLAPDKSAYSITEPMSYISNRIIEGTHQNRIYQHAPDYAPAGQSTQMIIGASPESDRQILKLSQGLYRKYDLKRVYYSAYIPTTNHPALPGRIKPPLLREHRLYQADWLLRFYNFTAEEILTDDMPMLDERLDPKCGWALRHPEFFPIDAATASFYELLRVPGIGNVSARRILQMRRYGGITFDDLKKMGVVLKRAAFFLTCRGKYMPQLKLTPGSMRLALLKDARPDLGRFAHQLSIFDKDTGKNDKILRELTTV